MSGRTRRAVLRSGTLVGAVGLSGCLRFISGGGTGSTATATEGEGGSDIKDTDGDGVINTEDYAPWDPDVQEKSDLLSNSPTQRGTRTDAEPTTVTITEPEITRPPVLERELSDPNEVIPSGRQGFDRVHGTLTIEPETGDLVLDGDGTSGTVTAISGYLAADNLEKPDNSLATVENDTKHISGNVTFKSDTAAFDEGTFRGIAVRAVKSIDLVIGGEAVAESVNLVRFSTADGVFESTTVE